MPASYLGPLGSLVEFKPESATIAPDARSTFRTTLGGARFEQRAPRGRRQWSVVVGSYSPEEHAGLLALADGLYGPPPWVWVESLAQMSNLLSPEQALLDSGTYSVGAGITQGGAGFTADGLRYGRSVNVSGVNVSLHRRGGALDRIPVVPGIPITASVYASGAAFVRLDFLTELGVFVSNSAGPAGSGTMSRRTVTATPPEGAAGVQVVVVNSSAFTLPALTWTPTVQPWATGRGCNRATLDGINETPLQAFEGMVRSTLSFTIQELG